MRNLEGKVAVVTGAASGIGRAMAERFGREGMKVVLADVRPNALEETVRALRVDELEVVGVRTDVASEASVGELAKAALDAYGAIHLVCNNAGVMGSRAALPIWELPAEEWQWVYSVNFWGVLNGIRTFVPVMLEQGEEGHIVNTASVAGITHGGAGFMGIYGATKHGVLSLTESLQTDLRARGAKVNASVLCPGMVQTDLRESSSELAPEGLGPGAERDEAEAAAREAMWEAMFGQGIPPSQVADLVLEAVQEDRFYVLPHPNWDEVVRARTDGILARGQLDRSVMERLMASGRQL